MALTVGACGARQKTVTVTLPGHVEVSEDGESYRAVTKDDDGNEVVTEGREGELSITSAKGTVKMNTSGTLDELGVALYPGAEAQGDGMFRIETPDGVQCTASLRTSDARAKVVAFYKEKLARVDVAAETGDGASIVGATRDGTTVTIAVSDGEDGAQEIVISTSRPR